ncbi:hypothetical protein ACLB2K_008562 [Fragaria x ananassa]
MASDLSVELLEIVGKCLNFTNDVSRLRAVCPSWRSSVPPFTKNRQQLLSPIRGPIQLPKHSDSNGNWPKIMTLTKRVIYHVTHSSEALNLLDEDVRVVELAEAYSLKDISETGRDYRVAMSFNPSCPVLVVIVNGVLYYCNVGDDPIPILKPVEGLSEFFRLEDVIYYEEKFYVVSRDATILVLDSCSLQVMDILVKTRMSGHRKYLVESAGEIYWLLNRFTLTT